MVSVEEAYRVVLDSSLQVTHHTVALSSALHCFLAEQVNADRDIPPYDRATMDGIAIKFPAVPNKVYPIQDVAAAGDSQKELIDPSHCMEIMTGAVLPRGADTIIRYEDVLLEDGKARLQSDPTQPLQYVHMRGSDARRGDVLLHPGTRITSADIAVMAAVGKSHIQVFRSPRIAVVSTGNELVDIGDAVEPHQIRRSNAFAIEAGLNELSWSASQYHLPDQRDDLQRSLDVIAAEHDVIILSGGVSKGKHDYVPHALQAIGFKNLFHQVRQRPGKPFWFGVKEKKVVFALPGNPVSTLLCFYKYIRPWILQCMGAEIPLRHAVLGADFQFTPQLTYFLQVKVKVRNDNGVMTAYPDVGGGSGDFINLLGVDGFLELPEARNFFQQGESFNYIPFR